MTGFIVFGIFAVLIIDFVIARQFEKAAVMKGHPENSVAFWLCFFTGIIGYIYVASLPDLNQTVKLQEAIKEIKIESQSSLPYEEKPEFENEELPTL